MFKLHFGGKKSKSAFVLALASIAFVPLGEVLSDDVIIGRNDGDNMRWAAYRFDPQGVTPEFYLLGGNEQGHDWGTDRSAAALASGDLDGDGTLETVVGRDGHGPGGGMRWAVFRVFDDEIVQIGPNQGTNWGDDRGVTDIAVGDLDSDGRDEVIVGRSDGDGMRWAAYSLLPDESGFSVLGSEQGQGVSWGDSRSATALAVGDLNGDGTPEVVVGRDGHGPGGGMRWQAYSYSAGIVDFVQFSPAQGVSWGDSRGVEDIVTGDVDGDGLDEVIVGRSDGDGMRWQVFRFAGGNAVSVGSEQGEGVNWGEDRGVRALATGDLDGNGIDEVIVGRDGHGPGGGLRWAAYSLSDGDFALMGTEQGHSWGDDRAVTALATGDVDGDGRDDVMVGRNGDNQDGDMRWQVFRLTQNNLDFESVGPEQGHEWSDQRGTSAAVITSPPLDSDGDGLLDIWEISGIPGTDLNGTGNPLTTDPMHKDLIWEIDWMSAADAPTAAQVQALKDAFAAAPVGAGGINNPDGTPGITLWVDTGTWVDGTGAMVGDDLGGGTLVASPLDVSGLTQNFYTIKSASFSADRRRTVRYTLMASGPTNDTGTSTGGNTATTLNDTGQNWLPGEWEGRRLTITDSTGTLQQTATIDSNTQNQLMVQTDSGFTGFSPVPDNSWTYSISGTGGQGELGGNDFVEFNHNAATLMHEMGHNLNLHHGGDTNANCKVNYVSIMNYDHQVGFPGGSPGIPRVGGGTLIDFSPSLISGTERGLAPLPNVNETNLNEPFILDPSDNQNRSVYTNINGDKVQRRLDLQINWNSAAGTGPFAFDTDISDATTGIPSGCTNNTGMSLHSGYDDWSNIVLPIAVFGDSENSAVNPVLVPEPTVEEQEALGTALATTDLAAEKSVMPEVLIAGWEKARFELTIRNLGPNPADQAQLTDILPESFVLEELPNACNDMAGDLVCALGTIEVGAEGNLSLTTLTPASRVEEAGFAPVPATNIVTAQTTLGPDPDERNNTANATAILVPAAAVWYPFPDRGLEITDQFVENNPFHDLRPQALLTPAATGRPIPRLDGTHLTAYGLAPTPDTQAVDELLSIENVFGEYLLRATGTATYLLVPTGKSLSGQPMPPDTDTQTVPHYLCYQLTQPECECASEGQTAPRPHVIPVRYTDQFERLRSARIREQDLILCNPAEKNGEPIPNPDTPHLTCYPMEGRRSAARGQEVTLQNQFGIAVEELEDPTRLCVATRKEHTDPDRTQVDLTVGPALPEAPSSGLMGMPGFDYCVEPPVGGGNLSREITFLAINAGEQTVPPTTASVSFEGVTTEVLVSIPELESGEEIERVVSIPPGCFPGSCNFTIMVDSELSLSESNELNNSVSAFCLPAPG